MKRFINGWLFVVTMTLGFTGSSVVSGQTSEQQNTTSVPAHAPEGSQPTQGPLRPRIPPPRVAKSLRRDDQLSRTRAQNPSPQTVGGLAYPNGTTAGSSQIPYPRSASSFPQGNQSLAGSVQTGSSQAMAPFQSFTGSGQIPLSNPLAASQQGQGYLRTPSGQVAPYDGALNGSPYAGRGAHGRGRRWSGAGMGAAGEGEAGVPSGATAPPGLAEGILAEMGEDIGGGAQASFTPNMIGDLSPFFGHGLATGGHSPPPPPGTNGAALFYPTVRSIKISENQSPRPQDRFFFDFNYYSNVNSTINTADRSPINRMNAYSYIWGFEKTFDQGRGSFGMRLPLNSLTASASSPSISAPTSTALGNLDLFGKYILKENVETGSLISAGFALSPPTATSRFAGAPYVHSLNTTYFQPFIGYVWRMDRFYLQGFSGFNFPASNSDVTLMFNDIGMGYFLYQNSGRNAFVTGIAPTFEVHVNTPFNHRNPYNTFDPAASPYVTNLTYGLNVLFADRAMLTAALVTPVSSPKPFDAEFALLLNFYFGRTARRPTQILPPVVQ